MSFTVVGSALFFYALQESGKHYREDQKSDSKVSLRKFPFPFRAALTICSDIDSTLTLDEFLTIQEFLTTKNNTAMGTGVGLEIGNSFFPNDSEIPFAFLSENHADQEVITDLIKAGYIDCIHSFLERKRDAIRREVDVLSQNKCNIKVWINHAKAASNIGQKEWCRGDTVDSDHYHTDFSIPTLGCIFAWVNDYATISSVIGQGIALKFSIFFSAVTTRHFFQSLYHNAFKEIVKFSLSIFAKKYKYRKNNDLTYILKLDDQQKIFGFIRSNASYKGIRDGSQDLADILTTDIFNSLKANEGYMVVYTHLGKNDGPPFISQKTRDGLKLLEIENKNHYMYVTTTAKLLTYYVNRKYLEWDTERTDNSINIRINRIIDPVRGSFEPKPSELQGLTFYTDDPDRTRVFIGTVQVKHIEHNGRDHTGRESVMIPLIPLDRLDNTMKLYRDIGYFGHTSQENPEEQLKSL